jgi:outer membrane protein
MKNRFYCFNVLHMRSLLILLTGYFLTLSYTSFAQQNQWSLEECLKQAEKTNLGIQEAIINKEKQKIRLSSARLFFLPSLDANLKQGNNWGLFIDPTTNLLTDAFNNNLNGFFSSSIDLFSGFRNRHILALNHNRLSYADLVYKQRYNQVYSVVVNQYFRALLAQEQFNNSQERLKQLTVQRSLVEKMVKNGIHHQRDLYTMDYLIATEERQMVAVENDYQNAILTLMQSVGLQTSSLIEITALDINHTLELVTIPEAEELGTLVNNAQDQLPESHISRQDMKAMELQKQIQQSYLYPRIFAEGRIGTFISSINPVPSSEQVNRNFFQHVGVGIHIPLFARFTLKNNIAIAGLDVEAAKITYDRTNMLVEQRVMTAYLNMKSASKNYQAVVKQLNAITEEYKYAVKLFELGSISLVDYGEIRNRFVIVQSEALQAKYDLVLKMSDAELLQGKYIY